MQEQISANVHRLSVKRAIRGGNSPPDEVLADYDADSQK